MNTVLSNDIQNLYSVKNIDKLNPYSVLSNDS